MPWYLYTGNRVRAIQTGHGNTVAVQPYDKVEIHRLTQTTQKMIAMGALRVTGAPPHVVERAVTVHGGGTVLQASEFATYFTEIKATGPHDLPVPVAPVPVEAGKNVSAPVANDTVDTVEPDGEAAVDEEERPKAGRGKRS